MGFARAQPSYGVRENQIPPDIKSTWRTFYGSSAVLKSTRDCIMLGWSMRRVGLIDITVGNATRLGASQRSATRRCASQHIATQRLSRRGSPAARADGPPAMMRALNHGKPNPPIRATARTQQSPHECAMTQPGFRCGRRCRKTGADRFMKCPGFGANAR
jgi:hypothetical protein